MDLPWQLQVGWQTAYTDSLTWTSPDIFGPYDTIHVVLVLTAHALMKASTVGSISVPHMGVTTRTPSFVVYYEVNRYHPTRTLTLTLTRTLWGDQCLDAAACEGSRLIGPIWWLLCLKRLSWFSRLGVLWVAKSQDYRYNSSNPFSIQLGGRLAYPHVWVRNCLLLL